MTILVTVVFHYKLNALLQAAFQKHVCSSMFKRDGLQRRVVCFAITEPINSKRFLNASGDIH